MVADGAGWDVTRTITRRRLFAGGAAALAAPLFCAPEALAVGGSWVAGGVWSPGIWRDLARLNLLRRFLNEDADRYVFRKLPSRRMQ